MSDPGTGHGSPRLTVLGAIVALGFVAAGFGPPGPRHEPAAAIPAATDCPLPDEVESAEAQRDCGQETYERTCAVCHEEEDGTGTILDVELLTGYDDALAVFDYVWMAMPEDDPGSLSDGDYWAAVAYLLDSRGIMPEGVVLSMDTAESVLFRE